MPLTGMAPLFRFWPTMTLAVLLVLMSMRSVAAQSESWATSEFSSFGSSAAWPIQVRYLELVHTGSAIIALGGLHPGPQNSTNLVGMLYDLSTKTWQSRPILSGGVGAPIATYAPVVVWTGSKLVVFGGAASSSLFPNDVRSDGGAYDPSTDTWDSASAQAMAVGAPEERFEGFGAWTGSRVLAFGGIRHLLPSSYWQAVYSGGLFDPVTNSWDSSPGLRSGAAYPQSNQGAVWTGTLLMARGGTEGIGPGALTTGFHSAGVAYEVTSDSWLSLPLFNGGLAATARAFRPAVWTGEYYIEYGGLSSAPTGAAVWKSDGYCYEIVSDSFLARPSLNVSASTPGERAGHSSVWTGSHVLLYSGNTSASSLNGIEAGALYDPIGDSWVTAPSFQQGIGAPPIRNSAATAWTGHLFFAIGQVPWNVPIVDGGVYVPPRVAPTIRNLEATPAAGKPMGDRGASAGNPLTAKFNQSFKHRIVCYGTPEAAVITYPDKPWWMTVGWGGPGPLVAHGTGQGNGGTGGAPPGTGAPFHPWFSATGGTADGQWIRGTPGPRDTGLHSFTVHAHNGIFPDTATKTVWIEVEGPSVIASMPTTYAAGAGQPLPNPQATGGGQPLPPVTHEVVALAGVSYLYFPTINAIPAGTQGVTATWTQTVAWNGVGTPAVPPVNQGLPAWLAWDGFSLSGIPGVGDEYQTINVSLVASNAHGSDTQLFVIHVLPYRPIHAAMLDVNGDSVVDVLDVQTIVNLILSIPVFDMSVMPPVALSATVPHPVNPAPSVALRGDVTLDGSVDTVDVQALVNGILGR